MIVYDPRNMEWDYWCALMAELFAAQQVGTASEENWRDWADGLQGIGYFVSSDIPDQRMFETWNDWAENLVGAMRINA